MYARCGEKARSTSLRNLTSVRKSIKPWDIAAGGLLVREAGGRATSTAGDEEFVSTGTIVVSNGLLHEQILRVLREGDNAPLPQ